jgi:hypothetical protein
MSAKDWASSDLRITCGQIVLALAILLPFIALLIGFTNLLGSQSREWVGMLLNGPSEVLCLLAVAILGKEFHARSAPKVRRLLRLPAPAARVSKLRYYCGLAGCLFNALPLYLYAYLPDMMPAGSTKYLTMVIADLVFLGSLFFAGGELWEKIRRIFVWEGWETAGK